MLSRHVALIFAVSLAACQTASTAGDGSYNSTQNQVVPLGTNSNSTQNQNVTTVVVPAANTNSTTAASGASATYDANGVQYLGRVATSTSLLTWSGSGVTASFTGTSATLSFLAPTSGTAYIGLSVDGGNITRFLVDGVTPITTGTLSSGSHTLTAVKLNEDSLGTTKFVGISTANGITQAAAVSRRIEFIGDSITLGYGIEGVSPCTNSSAMENATKTYGALTATALNAQYDLIAWSGKGLTRNAAMVGNDTSPIMPVLWTLLNPADSTSLYDFPTSRTPNAVVINLGTNDFTYIGYDSSGTASTVRLPLDAATYQSAMASFVTTVRGRYPNAAIVLCSSPMLSDSYPSTAEAQHTTQLTALQAVVAQLGDAKVQVLDFPSQTVAVGLNGCDTHPSPAEHQTMATLLTPVLKTALGW